MENQIKISGKLQKARTYEIERQCKKKMIQKPQFHVCAPVGWINDPNGFSEFKGEAHLFFQYHPYDTVWGPMHWGHVKTLDFIRWENMPVALAPDEKYDGYGCFSGSAIEWNGKQVLAYTGAERKEEEDGETTDYQTQCIAVGDGVNYEKIAKNPVLTGKDVPAGCSVLDFRDPKIWAEEDGIYMVVGNRSADDSGQILMYRTNDLEEWEFVTVLDSCRNRYGKMWECPDFFPLDGTDVLLISPQEMEAVEGEFHAGDGTISILGDYNKETRNFTERQIRALDYGLDFYAPQTMQTSDGRRIMIAWMQSWTGNLFDHRDGFCGMMTIPRELHVRDGKLIQVPVKELEQYYGNKVEMNNVFPTTEYQKYGELSGREQNLDITLESEGDYRFEMRLAADDACYTLVAYDKKEEKLVFDRTYSGVRRDVPHKRVIKTLSNGSKIVLRVLMDRYSIELFFNDGEQVVTSVIRTPFETDGIYMRANGAVCVSIVKHDIFVK